MDDLQILIHGHLLWGGNTQDIPGQCRDASGSRKGTLDGYTDLVETHVWGSRIFISLEDVKLSIRGIYDNSNVSWWQAVTTGYLDPNLNKTVRVRLLVR